MIDVGRASSTGDVAKGSSQPKDSQEELPCPTSQLGKIYELLTLKFLLLKLC